MTVTYTGEVATCRGFGTFLKVLYRWRGSIYKLVWLDLLVFLLLYYVLNLTYRLLLDEHSKRVFEGVVNYCSFHGNVIPLSFVLGFYVTVVMNRWWNQYTTIPWPDSIAVFVSATIHGQDERGRLMRRTIVRYVCLCLTMVLTMISPRVKKRFPTLNNFVDAGLLLENEKMILDNLNDKFPKPSKHWLPIVWATSIVTRARKEGRIRDDFAVKTIIDELNKFRGQAGLLLSYDTISVPLVYTQVVTIAVYSYFITSALGSQWVDNKLQRNDSVNISNIDLYFPIFTTLEFFFYMGWLKVAESLINPFGEDDDDFEVNWLIDRDLQVSYMIVDEMHHEHPELIKDQYWDEVFPSELPYTIATENNREEHPEPSTARVAVPVRQRSMVLSAPSNVKIDELNPSNTVSYKFDPPEQLQMNDDAVSGIHFIVNRGSKRGKKDDRNSMGSTNSMASLQQTPMTRTNSVTSMLKRLFSKDDQRPMTGSQTDGGGSRFMISASNPTLNKPATAAGGSMKIANDIIEEVDEQATITSMGKRPEARLMTNAEYHAEELAKRKEKQAARQNSFIKGEKLLTLSSRIGQHDLMTGVKKMLKLLEKHYEVRVVIAGDDSEASVKSEKIYSVIENEVKSVSKVVQKRLKGNSLRFQLLPIKETSPQGYNSDRSQGSNADSTQPPLNDSPKNQNNDKKPL